MNVHFLVGRLGADVELKQTASGTAVANVSLATHKNQKVAADQWDKVTLWHKVVVWGKNAERVAAHVKKGDKIAVFGRSETRSYENKDGAKVYVTEVHADQVDWFGQTPAAPGAVAGGDDEAADFL